MGASTSPHEDGDEVDSTVIVNDTNDVVDEDDADSEDDWVPGQDVQINYKAILEILTATLDSSRYDDSVLLAGLTPRPLRGVVPC